MDAERFDQVSRTVAVAGTRRGIARFLVGLPLLMGMLVWLGVDRE